MVFDEPSAVLLHVFLCAFAFGAHAGRFGREAPTPSLLSLLASSLAMFVPHEPTRLLAACACAAACVHGAETSRGLDGAGVLLMTANLFLVVAAHAAESPFYPWALVVYWASAVLVAWFAVLRNPAPLGTLRTSGILLASSLLADLPGLVVWAATGSYREELHLSVLSLAGLCMVPFGWTRRRAPWRS